METMNMGALASGTVLHGRYRIQNVISQGIITVYRAMDVSTQNMVCVREYYPIGWVGRNADNSLYLSSWEYEQPFATGYQQFVNDANIASQMGSIPGVAQVLDIFNENSTVYMVTESPSGQTLRQFMESGQGGSSESVFGMAQSLLNIVSQVHKAGLTYGYLCPENVVLCSDGQIRLTDYVGSKYAWEGLLKEGSVGNHLNGCEAPEMLGRGSIDSRTDVYAIGAIIYRLLTGRAPADAAKRMNGVPVAPPQAVNPQLEQVFAGLIMHALEMEPGARFSNADEFAQAFARSNNWDKKEKKKKKNSGGRAILITVAVGILFIIGLVVWSDMKPTIVRNRYGTVDEWNVVTLNGASVKIPDKLEYNENLTEDATTQKVYTTSLNKLIIQFSVYDFTGYDDVTADYLYSLVYDEMEADSDEYDSLNRSDATYNNHSGMELTFTLKAGYNDEVHADTYYHSFIVYEDGYLIEIDYGTTDTSVNFYQDVFNTLEF